MAKIPNVIDASLVLLAASTKTSTGSGAALDLGEGYAPDEPGQPMAAVVPVTALDLADENETYSLFVQDSPNGTDWTTRSIGKAVTETGVVVIPAFITARYVRLGWTLGGTTPSITVDACALTVVR